MNPPSLCVNKNNSAPPPPLYVHCPPPPPPPHRSITPLPYGRTKQYGFEYTSYTVQKKNESNEKIEYI